MTKTLFSLALLFFVATSCFAQGPYDGFPDDSVVIRLNADTSQYFIRDTAASPLWQIGSTKKAFYTGDTISRLCMITDTTAPYPTNANNWFIIKVPQNFLYNVIVDFWHRFSTDSAHDGGVVEFSMDEYHMTWENVTGDCYLNSGWATPPGIYASNFYDPNDTLVTGEPSFSGSSGSKSVYSRLQFFSGFPLKGTAPGCSWMSVDTIYLRFRYISDTTADTLAGWEIDSVKIEYDYYGDAVGQLDKPHSLPVSPNPSATGIFTFPDLGTKTRYSIDIYNSMGALMRRQPYTQKLNMCDYPCGLYFYRVTDGTEYYSGQLLKE